MGFGGTRVTLRPGWRLALLALLGSFCPALAGEGIPQQTAVPPTTVSPIHKPELLRVGYENTSYFPWSMPDGTGVDLLILNEVAQSCGVRITFQTLPWKDCLQMLQQGTLDCVINASFSPERNQLFAYPMKNGQPNQEMRTHMDGYSLYRRRGVTACWTDGKLQGYTGAVAVQSRFSVIDLLKQAGVQVDDHYTSAEEILTLMASGTVEVAALLNTNADHLLHFHPEWAGVVEKYPEDLVSKPYFLIFNRAFSSQYTELIGQIWERYAMIRSSARYGQLVSQAFRQTMVPPAKR